MLRSTVIALTLVTALAVAGSAAEEEPMRIFIRAGLKTHNPVTNGQHDYPAFLGEWSNILLARGARVDGALHFPSESKLAETDVMVIYKGDGGICNAEERRLLDGYLRRGGGLVILHDGMCSDDATWFATVAGAAKQHGEPNWERGLLKLKVVDREHPITKGLADFDMDDEAFYRLRTAPGMLVLLESPLPEGGDVKPQAWAYERSLPGGEPYRSFVWMQGHYTAKLAEPGPRDLILRGIAWAGGRDVDALLEVREPAGDD